MIERYKDIGITLDNTACGDPAPDHCPTCTALMHLCDKCERELDAAKAAPSPRVSEQEGERALFEAHLRQRWGGLPRLNSPVGIWAWEAWQARGALIQQATPAAPIYQLKSFLHPHGWHDTDQQTYEDAKANGHNPRTVYASPVAAPAAPNEQLALLNEILTLAESGMCHGLLADDYCSQIVTKIKRDHVPPPTRGTDSQHGADSVARGDLAKVLWDEALCQAAFYVAGHCANGDYHAEAIMGMPMPTIRIRTAMDEHSRLAGAAREGGDTNDNANFRASQAATTASQSDADKMLAMRAEYDRQDGAARGTLMGGATTASSTPAKAASVPMCESCDDPAMILPDGSTGPCQACQDFAGEPVQTESTTASATWTQEQLDQIGRSADAMLAKMGTPRMLGDEATTASASGELLPCPFCGTAAELVDQGTGSWRVTCRQSKGGCGAAGRMTFDKRVTATAAWNRRAPAPSREATSARALAWYDQEQAENGITRDSFHLFVLKLIDELRALPSREAAPLADLYQLADNLYEAGYKDRKHECDYDPRGCAQWQAVVDAAQLAAIDRQLASATRNEVLAEAAQCILADTIQIAGQTYLRINAHYFAARLLTLRSTPTPPESTP
jgi:hypothetical protein